MKTCHYCGENKIEDSNELRPEKNRLLLLPNGQKIAFKNVCFDCNHIRLAWQRNVDAEKEREAERRRQWHKDVAARREQSRAEIEARRVARGTTERARDLARMSKLEADLARIPLIEAELEALRKKYFQTDDKST